MAEVRQIPSAVGAFEAQVFDLSKTYRTIMTQEAQRRKVQADAKKEAEKTLSEMSSTMAKGRTQDLPYLKELYDGVTNFYSQNASKLKPGTPEYNKYTELKGKFNFESQRSINEKESDKLVANWMAINSDKEKIGQGSLDYWQMKQKPINDTSRATYKFKKGDGTEVSVDQVGLPDLEKYNKYDENDTRKDIQTIQPLDISTTDFIRNYKGVNVPFGTMKETVLKFKPPSQILQAFDSNYTRSRDAIDFYDNAWNNLSQNEKDAMNTAFSRLPSILNAAGIKEQVRIDEKDGMPGISNGYEFGAAKFLLQNLPETVKEDIDLSLANLYETKAYRKSVLALRKQDETKPIEQVLIEDVRKAGAEGFDGDAWASKLNSSFSISDPSIGGTIPVRFTYDKNTKEMVVLTQKALTTPDGKSYITKKEDAKKIVGNSKDAKKDASGRIIEPGITVNSEGIYFYSNLKRYRMDPSIKTFESGVVNMVDDTENVLSGSQLNTLRGLRKQKSTEVYTSPVTGAEVQMKRGR